MKITQRRSAFTIIELLMVVAIIGILATLIIVSLQGAQAKGRDAKRKANARSIHTALSQYHVDNNATYPVQNVAGGVDESTTVAFQNALTPAYLASTSAFTSTSGKASRYISNQSGANYAQAWELENITEAAVSSGSGVYATTAANAVGGAVAVSSSGAATGISENGLTALAIPAKATYNGNAFSVSFWYKPTDFTVNRQILYKCLVASPCPLNDGWKIETNGLAGRIVFTGYIGGTVYSLTTTTSLTLGAWNNVVVTYDGGTLPSSGVVYINGVANAATFAIAPGVANRINNFNSTITVGAAGAAMYGAFDDLRLYNAVVSAAAVTNMYGSGTGQYANNGESGIVGGWRFDEGTAITANDLIAEAAPLVAGTANNIVSLNLNAMWTTGVASLGLTWTPSVVNGRAFVTYGPQ